MRQWLTAIGGFSLMMFLSPAIGIALACLALAGESMDRLALRHIIGKEGGGAADLRSQALATVSAALQAMTIAACVATAWFVAPGGQADFFAAAFLAAATTNAGLTLPHHVPTAIARFVVYGITLAILAGQKLLGGLVGRAELGDWAFDSVAMIVLTFMTCGFISFIVASFSRAQRYEAAILAEQASLLRSQAELEEKERQARRLALVAEHANDSVIITDANGKISWVNDTFTRLTGYSFNEAIGERPGTLLNSDQTAPDIMARLDHAHAQKEPLRVEVLNRTKSGQSLWIETSLTPIFNPDGTHAMSISVERDITATKEREADLARARAEAEAAASAKSRFLATMSHEIRTPMNGVMGMANLLRDTALTEDQRHYVETILHSGASLLTIINDILDMSRLQSGTPTVRAAPFSVTDCLTGVAGLLRPLAENKGIALSLEMGRGDVPQVLGDAGRMRQILMNLVGNAIKFTSEGGITIRLIHAPQGEAQHRLAIEITDSGIGIAESRLDAVFDSFTQADDDISRRYGGTGLGLTISRMLAREMGGDLTVRSVEGKGSTFRVEVSLPEVETRHPLAGAANQPTSEPQSGTCTFLSERRILVAEDNATNRLIVSKMLDMRNLRVLFATDGAEAVAAHQHERHDLILMDLSMPGMDGREAVRRIRAAEARTTAPRCTIVALTANAFEEDRRACLADGFDDFLTKPLAKADLHACLMRHLGQSVPAKIPAANGL